MPESTNSSRLPDPHLWITILAGGSGTRFWPLSTPSRPKQLLPLAGENPLIRDTLDRARGLVPADRIRILTGSHLLGHFQEALGSVDETTYLIEPQAKGTGPTLTWAAWSLYRMDPEAVMISLHADHAIHPTEAFLDLLLEGGEMARQTEALFTVAVPPSRPETGYGYIRPGKALPWEGAAKAFEVDAFVEKPDGETARLYMEDGYLWNSGIFLWKAGVFLEEVKAVAPELGDLIPLLERGEVEEFFRKAPAVSVDEAVLERSPRVATLEATFSWDDVGAWEALDRTYPSDGEGNVAIGSVHAVSSKRNIVMAEEGNVVLFGVDDLVVVRSGDTVLVTSRSHSADLKTLVQALPPHLRDPEGQ